MAAEDHLQCWPSDDHALRHLELVSPNHKILIMQGLIFPILLKNTDNEKSTQTKACELTSLTVSL